MILPAVSPFHELAFAEPTSDQVKAEAQAALAQMDALQAKLDAASGDYGRALMEKEEAEARMDEVAGRISAANDEIQDLQDRLGLRARSMYKSGSSSFLDLLMGATSFKAFATNWELLNEMSEDDASLVQKAKELRSEIEREQQKYAEDFELAEARAEEAFQAQIDANLLVDEMQAAYNKLSSEALQMLEKEEAAREAAMREEVQRQLAAGDDAGAQQEAAQPPAGSSSSSSSGNSGNNAANTKPLPNVNIDNNKEQFVPGDVVVARAYGEIGKPYVWGACGPESFDCSGLVSYCLCGEYGKRLGTTYTFYYWNRVTKPLPGDICTSWEHCGIYIGDGQMIHAPNARKPVQVGSVRTNMIFVRF